MEEEKKVITEEILDAVKTGFDLVDKKFNKIDGRITKIETTMVTKDYLDEKLADLRGDLVVLTRKEDRKVRKLVDILSSRKVISAREADEILAMEPFPELGLRPVKAQ